jgi:hypothetical protein
MRTIAIEVHRDIPLSQIISMVNRKLCSKLSSSRDCSLKKMSKGQKIIALEYETYQTAAK